MVFDRLIVLSALVVLTSLAAPSRGEDPAARWSREGWPLLQRFCLDCHNADTREGELDLTEYRTLKGMEGGGSTMQRVLEMVRFGAMPPEDADTPNEDERKTLVASLDRTLFAVSCDLRPRPGKVTARRLNRAEYNHTIRDLFGIDLRPADAFPSDEVGAGFDNNGDVLTLSPMLIEKYIDAAETVSTHVLFDPASLPRIKEDRPGDQLLILGTAKTGRFNGRFLTSNTIVAVEVTVPLKGEYRVRVSGGNTAKARPETMVAVYDRQGLLRGNGELKYYGGGGDSERFEFKVALDEGDHRFYVEPLEKRQVLEVDQTRSDRLAKLDEKAVPAAREQLNKPLKPDDKIDEAKYPFMIRRVSIEGPADPGKDALPPSHYQILRRQPKRRGDRWEGVQPAAVECLQPLMRRAFRQSVSREEVEPYARLVTEATERGESFHRGLQIAVSAVLMSPRFLFRVETPPNDWKGTKDEDVRLTPHQLATRLSYFLWSSMPDEQLLSDADKNRLDDKNVLSHVHRMLNDEKADALATQFAAQWLGLRNLRGHEADTDQFAGFDDALKRAMARETELLFLHVVRNNRPVAELLTADYTFLNQRLAEHYGIKDGPRDDQFVRVSLQDSPRRGVLSHASVLTLTSKPTRTSPVKRGKWILENVMGTPPPEPPAGVPELEEMKTADADATFREQLELHRADPACAACHRVMDQLGFGLEQFDAVGRFRLTVGKIDVDASGELPGGRSFNGAAELSDVLGKSERKAFARTVTERLLTFALGRQLSPADRCIVDEIVERTSKQDFRFVDLLLEVVSSRPFQYYQLDESQHSDDSNGKEES